MNKVNHKTPSTFFADDLTGYGSRKEDFHSEAKSYLKSVAKAMGYEKHEFSIRSNKAGPAVSGDITLHADNMYIQIAESLFGPGAEILYRSCKSQKDYTGDLNNFIKSSELREIDFQEVVAKFERVREQGLRLRESEAKRALEVQATPAPKPTPIAQVRSSSEIKQMVEPCENIFDKDSVFVKEISSIDTMSPIVMATEEGVWKFTLEYDEYGADADHMREGLGIYTPEEAKNVVNGQGHYDCGPEYARVYLSPRRNSIFSASMDDIEFFESKGYTKHPIEEYEHSSVHMRPFSGSMQCRFDSSLAYMMTPKESQLKPGEANSERLLEQFSDWCNGNIVSIRLEDCLNDNDKYGYSMLSSDVKDDVIHSINEGLDGFGKELFDAIKEGKAAILNCTAIDAMDYKERLDNLKNNLEELCQESEKHGLDAKTLAQEMEKVTLLDVLNDPDSLEDWESKTAEIWGKISQIEATRLKEDAPKSGPEMKT